MRALLTPIKKIVSFLVYPIAYMFRNKVTRSTNAYTETNWELDKILKENSFWQILIWIWLDDSIHSDYKKEYHPTRHQNRIANFLDRLFKSEFFRSWYWSGIRNSSNNLSHLLAYYFNGRKHGIEQICLNNKYIRFIIKRFEKSIRPYLELHIGGYEINIGWLDSGKFEGPKIRKITR